MIDRFTVAGVIAIVVALLLIGASRNFCTGRWSDATQTCHGWSIQW